MNERESRTAIAVPGTFEDERPVRGEAAPAGNRRFNLIAAAVGAGIGLAVLLVLVLRSPSQDGPRDGAAATKTATNPATTSAAIPAAAAPAMPPAAAPPVPVEAAKPAAAVPTPPVGEAAGARPSRSRRRHAADDAKADPLHRAIPVPAEPTPAELKNPFGSP